MKCWICGEQADSGEHRLKASDLRLMYGHVSQSSPIYLHTDERRNQVVKGLRSNLLKSDAMLCSKCNNQLTQPYDIAWQKLSEYLRKRHQLLRSGQTLRLDAVFPGAVGHSMLRVHLYFVKLFGCSIVENDIPIAIQPFASALLTTTAHPNVHLAIAPPLRWKGTNFVGATNVHMLTLAGKCRYASWFYILDRVTVRVVYSVPGERRLGLLDSWHPSTVRKRLRVAVIDT